MNTTRLVIVVAVLVIGLSVGYRALFRAETEKPSTAPEDSIVHASQERGPLDSGVPEHDPRRRSATQPSAGENTEPVIVPTKAVVADRPTEPFELDGVLRPAKSCLRDPFYNPTGATLTSKQVAELQAAIDTINRGLAEAVSRTEGALKALIEDKFASGRVTPAGQATTRPEGGKVLFETERMKLTPAGSVSSTAVVLAGEDPAIDAMIQHAHDLLIAGQDVVREKIASMVQ